MTDKETSVAFKAFVMYLKNHPYKFNGIEIEYHLTDNNFIEFYFNPNEDINYYEYTLSLGIELFLEKFLERIGFLNARLLSDLLSKIKVITEKPLNLTNELLSKIDEKCSEIDEIVFEFRNNTFTSNCRVDFISCEPDSEGLFLNYNIELLNPKINGIRTTNPDLMINGNRFFFETLSEYEYKLVDNVTELVWDDPNLISQGHMFVGKNITYQYKGKDVWEFI